MALAWFIVAAVFWTVIIGVAGIFFGNWNPVQDYLKKHFGD